jgi:hypothetical protein
MTCALLLFQAAQKCLDARSILPSKRVSCQILAMANEYILPSEGFTKSELRIIPKHWWIAPQAPAAMNYIAHPTKSLGICQKVQFNYYSLTHFACEITYKCRVILYFSLSIWLSVVWEGGRVIVVAAASIPFSPFCPARRLIVFVNAHESGESCHTAVHCTLPFLAILDACSILPPKFGRQIVDRNLNASKQH